MFHCEVLKVWLALNFTLYLSFRYIIIVSVTCEKNLCYQETYFVNFFCNLKEMFQNFVNYRGILTQHSSA